MDELNKKVQEKSISLLGERALNLFSQKTIAILGLGGVGGTALCALARSGFMNFFLVDSDRVDYSNLNRQVLYFQSDVGLRKVDCALSFLGSVTDGINAICVNERISQENASSVLDKDTIHFIVDAIDDVEGKVAVIKYAKSRNIPILVSGGMGNRVNPTKLEILSLDKVTHDPLLRKLRSRVREEGIDPSTIMVVHSTEEPMVKDPKPYSMIMVPSAAGLFICSYVINYFINELPPEVNEDDVND